jgi:signal transduction histidine kinase
MVGGAQSTMREAMEAVLTDKFASVTCAEPIELALALFAPEAAIAASSTEPLEQIFDKVERAKREWEATVDTLTELVCLVDECGHIIRANRTIEQWQIGRVDEVCGVDLHTVLHPNCSSLFCLLKRSLQQVQNAAGRAETIEIHDVILGRHLHILARPVIPSKADLPNAVVVVVRDITAHKQNEEALRRYTARLEAMNAMQRAILAAHTPEEIALAALTHIRQLVPFLQARVILFNTNAQDNLMLTADANGETHLRPFCSSPSTSLQLGGTRRLGNSFVISDLAQLGDLSAFELQLLNEGVRSYANIPLLSDSSLLGSLLLGSSRPDSFDDEQLAVAREIGTLLAIATCQAQLHRQLQHTNLELHHALRSKEELLQNVSHELRTPLSLIYGYTALLENDDLGPLAAEQKQAIQIMLQHEERLRFMVDRLVMLRTLEAQNLQRLPLQLIEWLPRQVRRWQEKVAFDSRDIRIQLDLPASLPVLHFDPEAIQQVFDNLLDNAVKFSLPNSEVMVQVKASGGAVIIAVQDHGIGLAENQLTEVFEQFYQVDGGRARQYGGMGIGLALCRTFIEAHGGRIWGESAGEGQGSTFFVALPVNGDAASDASGATA